MADDDAPEETSGTTDEPNERNPEYPERVNLVCPECVTDEHNPRKRPHTFEGREYPEGREQTTSPGGSVYHGRPVYSCDSCGRTVPRDRKAVRTAQGEPVGDDDAPEESSGTTDVPTMGQARETAGDAFDRAVRAENLIEQGEWEQAAADLAGALELIVEATRTSRAAQPGDDPKDYGLAYDDPSLSLPVVLTDHQAYTARQAAHADSWAYKKSVSPAGAVAAATRRAHGFNVAEAEAGVNPAMPEDVQEIDDGAELELGPPDRTALDRVELELVNRWAYKVRDLSGLSAEERDESVKAIGAALVANRRAFDPATETFDGFDRYIGPSADDVGIRFEAAEDVAAGIGMPDTAFLPVELREQFEEEE